MNNSLFENPEVSLFVECPNCHELLTFGVSSCASCREEISPDYAALSAVVLRHNTQAVSVANTISTFDAFIPIGLIVLVFELFTFDSIRKLPVVFLWPILPLAAIVVWFVRFGRFKLGDEEYFRSRREMRRSFCLWLALLVVEVLLSLVW